MRIIDARPDFARQLLVLRLFGTRRVGRAGVDIDDAGGDRREARVEVIGRLDEQDGFAAGIDAEIGEDIRFERLRAIGVENHLQISADEPDQRRRAEGDAARAKALPGFWPRSYNVDQGVDRRAAVGASLAAETQFNPRAFARREAKGDGDRVPDRRDRRAADLSLDQASQDDRAVAGDAAAGIVPDISDDHRLALCRSRQGKRGVEPGVDAEHWHRRASAHGEDFEPKRGRKSRGLVAVSVDDEHLRAHLGDVAGHEAVDERDRQNSALALHGSDAINESAHWLAAGRKDVDHAAVETRHHRLDFAAQRAERQVDDMFGALDEIYVRKFEKGGENIGVGDALLGEMAVRVELRRNQHVAADNDADAFEEIALAIVIALRHHGAVETENHTVDRQGGAKLVENLIAQFLVGFALEQAAGLGPGRGPFDEREPFFARAPP